MIGLPVTLRISRCTTTDTSVVQRPNHIVLRIEWIEILDVYVLRAVCVKSTTVFSFEISADPTCTTVIDIVFTATFSKL